MRDPFLPKGTISLSQPDTPAETDMPADPEPGGQSGSSYARTYGGGDVIFLKATRRAASTGSAVPPPQSIGTPIGLPGLEGFGVLKESESELWKMERIRVIPIVPPPDVIFEKRVSIPSRDTCFDPVRRQRSARSLHDGLGDFIPSRYLR